MSMRGPQIGNTLIDSNHAIQGREHELTGEAKYIFNNHRLDGIERSSHPGKAWLSMDTHRKVNIALIQNYMPEMDKASFSRAYRTIHCLETGEAFA